MSKKELNGSVDVLANALKGMVKETIEVYDTSIKGEIKKEIGALTELIASHEESVNKRFDALDKQLGSVENRLNS